MAEETEHKGAAAPLDTAAAVPVHLSRRAKRPAGSPAPAIGEPPPLPKTADALAGKAKNLEALRDAVVDAASVGAGLWFSYLLSSSTCSSPLAA